MSTGPHPSRPFARPAFPPLHTSSSMSSTSSTYQSYSSTSSLSTPSTASSAPLPSPSSTQQQHGFFASLSQQQQTQQTQQQQQQQQSQNTQHPATHHYQPNRDGAGRTAAETNNYIDQFALVAEAAKRAQMAVLMRDVEGMEL
ncbi:hypothetical protein EJ04DRAFT_518940 [Polyplosphaeria fusca]|uniref:Uncharacterized protein n=1 Tax=Polyplosphaeria fusca TaxID=682080 RepID=A0A9P4RBC6_9PLEO|nr:hypothetical protein EJ04DRAFT_518940 [Polyplosphaeria fusca]